MHWLGTRPAESNATWRVSGAVCHDDDGWQLEQWSPLNQRDGRIRSCRKGKEWEHPATEMNQYKACQLNHCWIVSQ